MVSADAIHAIVPFAITGKQQVTVETAAGVTNPIAITVSDADPALLGALNQDGSANSPSNPAVRGSVVSLYAVGMGQTSPAAIDGALIAAPLPTLAVPVSVTMGDQAASVQYAGAAPGLVAGVTQINVQIPASLPAGNAQVVLTVGAHSSPLGPVISVR
jgi:uncharacterized protein (TIGR03437 family)